jgi:hypothetical protein
MLFDFSTGEGRMEWYLQGGVMTARPSMPFDVEGSEEL